VGRHRRLREDDRLGRVQARGQIGRRDLARLGRQLLGLLPDGDGVHVGDEDEQGRARILQLGEALQGAQIVAQVQGAGGLDAGQDAARTGVGGRGLISHGNILGTSKGWIRRARRRARSCGEQSAAPSPGDEDVSRMSHAFALIGS